jgi:murein DD-endopeptidase MepM/ murein hydrolase activator NlpD
LAVRSGEARRLLQCYLRLLATCTLIFIILSTNALAVSDSDWTVEAQPAQLVNGGPVLFQVKPPGKIESLTGSWLGHQFTFSYDASAKTWFALAGINLDTTPGEYPLELSAVPAAGKTPSRLTLTRRFAVADGNYPKIPGKLSVEGKFTEPDPEQQKQIEEASKIKKEYLTRVTAERGWSGQFAAPAEADISDVFGIQRVFNGKALSTHYGLDYRVHTGTPVTAMNSGTVLLARFLYYEGNFVVIDHGQGLLTLYLHLSEFKVKEGDQVKRGEIIGLSGGTGRATGPHLHVAVRWQGTYLDPGLLMRLSLP